MSANYTRYIFSLLPFIALIISGCTTLNVDERSISRALENQMPKVWDGKLHSKSKNASVNVRFLIKDVFAELSKNSKFHDVDISIHGNIVINDEDFATNTPFIVSFGSHSEFDKKENSLIFNNVLVRHISLPKLPKSYAVDLVPAITETLNIASNKNIGRVKIVDFDNYKNNIYKLNTTEDLKKTIEGNRIQISNK